MSPQRLEALLEDRLHYAMASWGSGACFLLAMARGAAAVGLGAALLLLVSMRLWATTRGELYRARRPALELEPTVHPAPAYPAPQSSTG